MKYIRIGALVLALLVVLAACGGKTQESAASASLVSEMESAVTETPATPAPAPESAEELPSVLEEPEPEPTPEPTPRDEHLGSVQDGVYENPFMGLGCAFDDAWEIATQEDLGNIHTAVSDLVEYVDESLAGMLQNSGAMYDFYGVDYEGYRVVNVNLENTELLYGETLTEREYAEMGLEQLRTVMGTLGLADSDMELTEMEFAGDTHPVIVLSGDFYSYSLFERIVCFEHDGYMAVITASSYANDETERLLEKFYTMD